MNKYKIIWKGKVVGFYSVEELRKELASGHIGLMYFVEMPDSSEIFVKDLLLSNSYQPDVSEIHSEPDCNTSANFHNQQNFHDKNSSDENGFHKFSEVEKSGDVKSQDVGTVSNTSVPIRRKNSEGAFADNLAYSGFFVYALCGASFLSAYIYAAAILFAVITYLKVSHKEAIKIGALSTSIFLMGLFFFNVVIPTLEY